MRGFRALALVAVWAMLLALGATAAEPAPPVGPPFPPPVTGQRVYDFAGALRPETRARAQQIADAIETRTAAQIVVYTQLKPDATTAETERDAAALIDQWGIGRKGFDDGLVVFFNLKQSLRNGQVQLYAAPGFAATFLTNAERQAIFDDEMLPLLRRGDMDGALLAALEKVDDAATSEHAGALELARQIDAVIGLIGAPVAFLFLVGWAAFHWLRFGRDPEYIDDSSIYAAGPPAELTPAAGVFVLDGLPSRRALTAALLDLASRGEFIFREDPQGIYGNVGVRLGHGEIDDRTRVLNEQRPIGRAEKLALQEIRLLGLADDDRYVDPKNLRRFGAVTGPFDDALEKSVVEKGWFVEAPRKARGRWFGRGTLEIIFGVLIVLIGGFLPSQGITLLGVAVIAAGIVTLFIAPKMPARTLSGAMVRAMLAAYRRTLEKTMAVARSMNQVIEEARLPWLQTPDQAVVWGTALGLQPAIEAVLKRSLEDLRTGRTKGATYLPGWYIGQSALVSVAGGDGSGSGSGSGGGIQSPISGLMSSSALPNFAGMFAVLGTIGNSPIAMSSGGSSGSSSSSSSSGSFGGGSSGGGGGGAGGGF